jgi:PAS domain-containing protein
MIKKITQENQDEPSSAHSAAGFERALECSLDGPWQRDFLTGEERWSSRFLEIIGREIGDVEANYDNWFRDVHPEDQERIALAMTAHLERRELYNVDYRFVLPDGSVRWHNCRGRAVFAEDGKPTENGRSDSRHHSRSGAHRGTAWARAGRDRAVARSRAVV